MALTIQNTPTAVSTGVAQNNSTGTSSGQSLSDKINAANSTQTSKGTTIVKPGQAMDKNAFLKILSAELSNQDPQNAQDGTQYVAQMAQFAGLEQMTNLNTTTKLTGANTLIGKQITLDKYDPNGNLYTGRVKSVVKSGDDISLNVVVGQQKDSNGNLVDNIQQFSMDDITDIADSGSTSNTASIPSNTTSSAQTLSAAISNDQALSDTISNAQTLSDIMSNDQTSSDTSA